MKTYCILFISVVLIHLNLSAQNVGIGTTNPNEKLHVIGSIKVVDGTEAAGKVLTSDAAGKGSWQTINSIPQGVIVMWSGAIASIPAGWAFCDGTLNTPDLRDKFILASGTVNAVNTTGGANTITLTTTELPAHTHTATTTSNGAHSHGNGPNSSGVFYSDPLPAELPDGLTRGSEFGDSGASGISRGGFQTSTDGAHTHTLTTDAMSAATPFDNRPAYYTLAYIMKL
jgi:microcystin-dependent protein